MPEIASGFNLDKPPLSSTMYWRTGYNVRSYQGRMETLGLFSPMRNVAGALLSLPGSDLYRSVLVCPGLTEGQILMASVSKVMAAIYDPASTIATGTRYALSNVTPSGLPAITDSVAVPSSGRTEITPVWWWTEATDAIYGMRAGVDEPVYRWMRDTSAMVPLSPCPHHAVGGAIIGSILMLLGADSFGSAPYTMTIRWSDRFNFESWTPSDINVSGEMQLEGGSRIVGGGAISQGVVVWTDKRMAMLTETGDPDSVFARRYVDGGRGLSTNRGWCEADGIVWWYDETNTLNQWSGGQPTQIVNPLKGGTIETVQPAQMARAYLEPNQKYGEIILWYPDPTGPMWTGLVYSYIDQVWSIWRLDRPGWGPRSGSIRTVGVDSAGHMFQHDLQAPISNVGTPYAVPPPTDIVAFDWQMVSNMLIPDAPLDKAHHMTQFLIDNIPTHSDTGASDRIGVTITGYGGYAPGSTTYAETKQLDDVTPRADFRVEGKAVSVTVGATACTSLFRMGAIEVIMPETSSR